MAHNTGPAPSSAASFSEPAPYQVNIMRTEPLASRTVQTDQDEALSPATTAVANPETVRAYRNDPYEDPYFQMVSPGVNCLEVPGKSHIIYPFNEPQILESFLKIRKEEDSLENHVATVAHYIDFVLANKKSPDVTSRRLPQFTQYLLTRSWKKMYRRIHHWASQGFIYQLSRVDETALRAIVEPAAFPLRNDMPLAIKLVSLDSNNLIPDVVKHTSTNTPLMITSLLTACQKMKTMPRSDRQDWSDDLLDEPDEMSGLYNRDTCFEFHQLLISTLLSFGKGLEEYAKAYREYNERKQDPQNFVNLVNCASQVYDCGSLLWIMAYSQILENHLKILHDKAWVALPTNSQENLDMYFAFTTFEKTKDQVIALDGVDRGVDEAGKGSGVGVDDCGDAGGGDEDDDFKTIADNATLSGKLDLAEAFPEWIRLQVDRFQATRKITSFLKRTRTPPVSLALLAVRHPKPMIAGEAMEPWRKTIRDIYTEARGGVAEAEKTIRILEKMIIQGVKTKRNSIFTKFRSPEDETYEYNATVHCEIVMAAIDEFGDGVVGTDALKDRIRNFDDSVIAVSKPCCPVCWELLNILRKNGNFHVDGYHKTLTQVELPEWLPQEIVVKLTDRFEAILLQQIRTLKNNHARHASKQSGDGLSSDSSDAEDDVADAAGYLRDNDPDYVNFRKLADR